MFWRRICGAAVMIVGASAAAAATTGCGVILAARLGWDMALDALPALAMVTAPPLAGGSLLLVLGRWIYGEWGDRAPIVRIASTLAQIAGVAIVVVMGGMFATLVFVGVSPADRQAAIGLAAGMAGGFLVTFVGWSLKPSRRRDGKYLD